MTTQPRAARLARGRALWVIPAVPAALITGFLAWGAWVSSEKPRWLRQGDEWWRVLLQPKDDKILLLVVLLWLAAAVWYWWPRWREPESVGLVIVTAMVVIGAVLGTAALAPCRGAQSRTAVVSWVLSLYVGQLEPRYGMKVCPSSTLPLALQLGRTFCLGATLIGALAAASVLWRQPVGRIRARLVKDATIVTGLDAMTIPLLGHLTATGHANRVMVIEPDGRHPLLADVRAMGAQIVVANPASSRVLLPMLRGLRGPQLRYLYALRADAAENEDVLSAAKEVLDRIGADPERPPHLIARIDDPRHADLLRGNRIGASSPWFEDALSPLETTACALAHQIYGAGARQVLLCGDSMLALAILLELAHRAWEHRGRAEAAAAGRRQAAVAADGAGPDALASRPVTRVILLDRRAADLKREYNATVPPRMAKALASVDYCDQPWRAGLLRCLEKMEPPEIAGTAVVIADAPAEENMHEAGRAARLYPGTPVFVLSSDGAGVTDAVFDLLRPFQRTLLVGYQAPEDTWTRIARHWHECYRLSHPATAGETRKLTRKPWTELDMFFRDDTVLELRSIMSAVVARGRRWVPVRALVPGSFVELDEADIAAVAEHEHTRWYRRRVARGWQPAGPGQADDDAGRINSNVRPWAELSAETRAGLADYARSQIGQLEDVGFMPVLPDDGPDDAACYERVGEVRAERLTARHAWRTPGGDQMSGAKGDWLVTDESGNERTVRDREFRASHTHVAGSRWRRTGNIRAWRVREAACLRTLEGNAVAQPGDWIVQGPGGARIPVTDEVFRHGYQPCPPALFRCGTDSAML